MKETIIIIDGNSLINRAYYALPKLTNSEGLHTNGIFGFTKMIKKIIDNYNPNYLVVAFDVKAPTFRHEQYKDYKGTRKGMPDELAMQMPYMKKLLDAFGIYRMEMAGYEADDLIGTVANYSNKKGIETLIVSGDKDNLQLVNGNIKLILPKKGISEIKFFERDDVFEELGVYPEHVIDFKALSGDQSDNIPGVKGIGAKTASKLIQEFGTLEEIYENIDSVWSERIKNLLITYKEDAVISKKLATIEREVPMDIDFEKYRFSELNKESSYELLNQLQMSSLLKYLGFLKEGNENEKLKKYNIVTDFDINKVVEKINDFGEMIFKIISKKIGTEKYDIKYLGILCGEDVYITSEFEKFKVVFEDDSIKKIGYILKEDYLSLKANGIDLNNSSEDLLISHYLLYPDKDSTNLEKIALNLLNYEVETLDSLTNKGKVEIDDIEKEKLYKYIYDLLVVVSSTRNKMIKELNDNDLIKLYGEVEIPLIEVLAEMEFTGFKVDTDVLSKLDDEISKRIAELETNIYQLSIEEFNINSPKQLGFVLFEKFQLPVIKKTKTGYSTNHDVLMKLRKMHPIIDMIIEYRTYSKLKSTYIDGLREVIDKDTLKVHSSFKQTIAVTGRLSSTEPNMQNIPIRLELGKELRKIFIPSKDTNKLIDADYNQIELRILAHLSQDENLIRAFRENIDIHTLTASQVFDVPIEEVTDSQRRDAKGVNFGIVYGISDYGLSENLGISRNKAKIYIENYFIKYPKVKLYLDKLIIDCKKNGYVETIMGRKRKIPEINSSNFNLRSFAQRTAMNTPIQGSAADIIKIAMIKVYKELKRKNLKSKLILQVHDELIIDATVDEIDKVREILRENMENAVKLSIPISVDMNVGDNWYETK